MPKPNFIFKLITAFFAATVCCAAVFAQAETKNVIEPSYEITLHVIVASKNAGDKSPVPQMLSSVVKKLKDNYPNSNYYLSSTYFQRVTNTGNFEFKGVSAAPSQNQDVYAPIFSEWTLGQLLAAPDAKGADAVQLKNFRFGQRVPVKTANSDSAGGKTSTIVNYEQIGLAMQKINLAENQPTIIGNFSGSSSDDLMFLVLTVKAAQN